jgi:hypothetical protein
MPRTLKAQDRSSLIRLASELSVGSPERKAILAGLRALEPKDPDFPTWWDRAHDGLSSTRLLGMKEHSGLTFEVRGYVEGKREFPLQFLWESGDLEGYILDGGDEGFGWALGFSSFGIDKHPEWDGHWLDAGEEHTLARALSAFKKAIQKAHENFS